MNNVPWGFLSLFTVKQTWILFYRCTFLSYSKNFLRYKLTSFSCKVENIKQMP